MKELEKYRDLMKNNDGLEIETKNKETGWEGVATFYKDDKTIKVFEGNSNGLDDAEYTYEEFINKYEYRLTIEK